MKTILILPRDAGLFSLVFQVLGHAYLAEKNHMNVFVYFDDRCLYWSVSGYNGSHNVWEYYFEQPFSSASQSRDMLTTNTYPDIIEWFSPLAIEGQREFVHGLIKKYLSIKPHITEKVQSFSSLYFAGKKYSEYIIEARKKLVLPISLSLSAVLIFMIITSNTLKILKRYTLMQRSLSLPTPQLF